MACQQKGTGFECEKGKAITISSPTDPSNPLVTHEWLVDGTQVSTLQQFMESYPTTGHHTVVHKGTNICNAACSQTAQLDIVDAIAQQQKSAAAPASSLLVVVGALTVIGIIGVVVMSKK